MFDQQCYPIYTVVVLSNLKDNIYQFISLFHALNEFLEKQVLPFSVLLRLPILLQLGEGAQLLLQHGQLLLQVGLLVQHVQLVLPLHKRILPVD